MPALRIAITQKQAASYLTLERQRDGLNAQLTTVAQTIIDGAKECEAIVGPMSVQGVEAKDGIYSLVVEVPEPPQAAE